MHMLNIMVLLPFYLFALPSVSNIRFLHMSLLEVDGTLFTRRKNPPSVNIIVSFYFNPIYVDMFLIGLSFHLSPLKMQCSAVFFFFFFFFCYRALLNLLPIFCFLMQVLPSLREKHDEFMLRELVKRWANHKVMVRWLSRFFHYLDRYFIARRSLPPLNEVGLACFRNQVCHG